MEMRKPNFVVGLLALPLLASCTMNPSSTLASTPARSLGAFEAHDDIGPVEIPGSATYDAETEVYTIAGSGANMWGSEDEFHFAWHRMEGDFILRTRAEFVGEGVDPHRKLGWIVRRTLDASSPYVSAAVHGDGLTALQFRRAAGGETEEERLAATAPDVIQLERKGDSYIMSVARFGETFVTDTVSNIGLGDEVYVGLFVCAHNEGVIETGNFRNVRMVIPAPEDLVAYQQYLGSNLEIVDVQTGNRTVLLQSPGAMQAPNWTPDGEALIYNQDGRLYRFDLATRTPTLIDTDFATRNNNDHVLSFDGTMLGISHHSSEDDGQSIVYTVPVTGGTPTRITAEGPSYLHGWSPDGQFLVYTGERDGEFDIYKIPASGGEEIRLTRAEGLDDGSEYTPDGEWIYFNSVRSGTMQIWRMRPDGSGEEQVTNDGFNNWFPHISPDGRWIAFLSYGPEIAPSDHPWYKQVYLRLMPIAGGTPKVIGYVYGGQGTINVPSWSPDGRYVAFVSNTAMR